MGMIQDVVEKAISEVRVSTLPQEKLKLAFNLMRVSSRILRVLEYRSSSILIVLFSQEALGRRVAKLRTIQS